LGLALFVFCALELVGFALAPPDMFANKKMLSKNR
jgi:hypothetical protein